MTTKEDLLLRLQQEFGEEVTELAVAYAIWADWGGWQPWGCKP